MIYPFTREGMMENKIKMQRIRIILFIILSIIPCKNSVGQDSFFGIIDEYLSKETSGEFLKQSDWLQNNISNHHKIPGFDSVIIIDSLFYNYQMIRSDSVLIDVYYSQIADLRQDAKGERYVSYHTQMDTVTFIVFKINSHWKILHPLTRFHILPNTCKNILNDAEYEKLLLYLHYD
jgi:hypothetical protein